MASGRCVGGSVFGGSVVVDFSKTRLGTEYITGKKDFKVILFFHPLIKSLSFYKQYKNICPATYICVATIIQVYSCKR